jgi:hypothetical protein
VFLKMFQDFVIFRESIVWIRNNTLL